MAKPRVHEIASELGIDSKTALEKLKAMGEFVKGHQAHEPHSYRGGPDQSIRGRRSPPPPQLRLGRPAPS